jgi:hypothetical protein
MPPSPPSRPAPPPPAAVAPAAAPPQPRPAAPTVPYGRFDKAGAIITGRGKEPDEPKKLSTTGSRKAHAGRASSPRIDVSDSKRSSAADITGSHKRGHAAKASAKAPNEATRPRDRRQLLAISEQLDEEEPTREIVLSEAMRKMVGRAVLVEDREESRSGDDWPTENLAGAEAAATAESQDSIDEPPDTVIGSIMRPEREPHHEPEREPEREREHERGHEHEREQEQEYEIPTTQALRVAVSRGSDGRVLVRLLDSAGLKAGEHDAVLVALTRHGDLSSLFK